MTDSEEPEQQLTAKQEIERFREEYRKAGCTEQEVNCAVMQAQLVGELPYEDKTLRLVSKHQLADLYVAKPGFHLAFSDRSAGLSHAVIQFHNFTP